MKQNKINLLLAVILILAAAISRVVLYPDNYSPIIGMALFGGAIINDKKLAFILPLFAMFISDILFQVSGIAPGFWGWGQLAGYGILAVITMFGFKLKKVNVPNIIGFTLASSAIFYIFSNLAFFLIDNNIYHTYPNTFNGFIDCYVKALPFLKWKTDLVFSGLLFGTYYLITNYALNNKKQVAA